MQTIKNITREELFKVPLPERTSTYTPLSHKDCVETLEKVLKKNHYIIVREEFTSAQFGNLMVGKFYLETEHDEFSKMIAVRNSYNKSASAACAGGAMVNICTNGCIWGEVITTRKHTGAIDEEWEEIVNKIVSSLDATYTSLIKDFNYMQQMFLSQKQICEIIGRLTLGLHDMNNRKEIINKSRRITRMQLGIIMEEMENSVNFPMKVPNDWTMWFLYNNVTESLKKTHPLDYIKTSRDIHGFFMEYHDAIIDEIMPC